MSRDINFNHKLGQVNINQVFYKNQVENTPELPSKHLNPHNEGDIKFYYKSRMV